MIGRLTGTIAEKSSEGVLLEVGGVGFDVSLPLSTLAALPAKGERVTLAIHTHVREDDIKLFGFASTGDRTAFRTMLKVSGVGPKLALAVLGALSGNELAAVIGRGDFRRLTAIPGIGKKTAERLVLELGGKLDLGEGSEAKTRSGVLEELSSALKNLGFKPGQVDRVVAAFGEEDAGKEPFEDLLRRALRLLQEKT